MFRAATTGEAARSRLAASWHRSLDRHNLDPSRRPSHGDIDAERLAERREELGHMLSVAAGKLDDLFSMIGRCGCAVVLTDAEGLILDRRSAEGDAAAFSAWGLDAGVDWSEAAQGTNGIGTSLEERRPVTIHRDQHFLADNIGMSCIDAPVFGPDGRLVAGLDVSSARSDQTEGFNRLIEGMVIQVARQIEGDLFRSAYPGHRILLASEDSPFGASMLAVDGDDVVVGATSDARRQFGLEKTGTLRPRPLSDIFGQSSDLGALDRAERAAVIRALTRAGGNVSAAARDLGIGRATLYRRMKRLGIGA